MDLLINGNIKMGKDVRLFNLPAKETCTPTHWCLKGKDGQPACYALRNNFLLPSVVNAANTRLAISQQPDFVDKMVAVLQRRKPNYFRLHSSGDFYSEEYVQKWIDIASQCQDTKFRTTTRRRDLKGVIQELNSLPNFIVRESLDQERDRPVMGLPFAAISSLPIVAEQAPYMCKNSCPECEYHCWESRCDMAFDEH